MGFRSNVGKEKVLDLDGGLGLEDDREPKLMISSQAEKVGGYPFLFVKPYNTLKVSTPIPIELLDKLVKLENPLGHFSCSNKPFKYCIECPRVLVPNNLFLYLGSNV